MLLELSSSLFAVGRVGEAHLASGVKAGFIWGLIPHEMCASRQLVLVDLFFPSGYGRAKLAWRVV